MLSRHLRRAATAGVTLALVAAALAATSTPATADPSGGGAAKLTAGARAALADGARGDYWVRFADGAADDTAARAAGQGWAARGRTVYDGLRAQARTSQADVRAVLDAQGADYTSYWVSDAILVRRGTLALATTLARESEVAEIRPTTSWAQEKPVATTDVWTDTGTTSWGVKAIHADQAWAQGVDGSGITVANLDTGVDVTHPALHDRYRGLQPDGSLDDDYSWYDVAGVCPTADPCDANGHGTHTMGTMLGSAPGHQVGIAPGATWIAVNGCAGGQCSDEALLQSAQWLLAPTRADGTGADPAQRPDVVNNSWGSDPGSSGNPFFDDVLDSWNAAGIFSSWSIGNSGPGCGTAAAPAGRATAYSVGAYGHTGELAFFSSRGPGQDGLTKPDIAAPGMGVVSSLPGGGYGPEDGTSMAAPHVAGAVALLWSARPELVGDLAGTERLLDRSAHDVADTSCGGTVADNASWGEGTLDAAALLAAAPTTFGTLTGTVVDGAGRPVPGAVVTASRTAATPGDRSGTTGADGTFALPLEPASYDVTISGFGHLSVTRTAVVPAAGGTVALGTIALGPAPRHTVTGTLTQPGGHPVIDTTVTLGHDVAPVTTGPDGTFVFPDVPEGRYTLRVAASVCGEPVALPVVVDGDETLAPVQGAEAALGIVGCRRIAGGFRSGTEVAPTTPGQTGPSVTRTLPFPFVWFGRSVQTVAVSPKGFLRFDPPTPDPRDTPVLDNPTLPDSRLTASVLPFLDDLTGATIYTATTTVDGEPAYVVEWRDATLAPATHPGTTSGPVDFSVTLTAGGDAIIGWGAGVGADAASSGGSATIGFQSGPDPGQALTPLQYGYDEPVATDGRGLVLDGEPTGFVHVSVTDANDHLPLSGARVTLTPEPGAGRSGTATAITTATDLDGEATVQLPLGAYTVATEAADYAGSSTTLALVTEAQREEVSVGLATGVATVSAPTLTWLVGPTDSGTGEVTVANRGTAPMRVSFGESGRDTALDEAVAGRTTTAARRAVVAAAAPPTTRRTRVLSSFDTTYDNNAAVAYDGTSLWTNELYGQRVARYGYDGTLRGEFTAAWDRTNGLLSTGDLAYDSTTKSLCEAIHGPVGGELRCYSRATGVETTALDGTWSAVSPAGLAYNAHDDVFYLSGNGYVFTVAGTTHASPGLPLHSCHLPIQDSRGLAYNPATGTLWEAGVRQDYPGFLSPRFDELQEISPITCAVVSTATVPVGISVGGLDIDPAGRLWMADPSNGDVHLLDVDAAVTTDLPWLTVPTGTATVPAGASRTFTVSVHGARAAAGVLAGNVVVRTSSGRDTTHLVPVTVDRSAYRVGVDVGGRRYRDRSGFVWRGDHAFRAGGWGFRGRTMVVRSARNIVGTTEDRLFRTARVARGRSFSYTFAAAPAGTYAVDLGFAEIAGMRKGERVFDVRVDGRTVLRGLDVARAGQRHALARTLRVTHRTRGPLRITFVAPPHRILPMVSSIRVTEHPEW